MQDQQTPPSTRVTFLCDAMLGSLARWLRFFGYDATYFAPGIADAVLAETARSEGRWLLTRDRVLAAAGPRTMFIRAERLDDQLEEVFSRLDLRPAANLAHSRCGECNGVLHTIRKEDVTELIPPYVFATATRFRRCDRCGRIYWPGSHSERIVDRMRAIVQS